MALVLTPLRMIQIIRHQNWQLPSTPSRIVIRTRQRFPTRRSSQMPSCHAKKLNATPTQPKASEDPRRSPLRTIVHHFPSTRGIVSTISMGNNSKTRLLTQMQPSCPRSQEDMPLRKTQQLSRTRHRSSNRAVRANCRELLLHRLLGNRYQARTWPYEHQLATM